MNKLISVGVLIYNKGHKKVKGCLIHAVALPRLVEALAATITVLCSILGLKDTTNQIFQAFNSFFNNKLANNIFCQKSWEVLVKKCVPSVFTCSIYAVNYRKSRKASIYRECLVHVFNLAWLAN